MFINIRIVYCQKTFLPISFLIQLSMGGYAILVKTVVPKHQSSVPGPLTIPYTVVTFSCVVCVKGPLKIKILFNLKKKVC